MKKYITTLIALQCCWTLFAQEFSMKLYFETVSGERDTLELGYDPIATHGIDEIFGEVDYGSPISQDKFQAFVIAYDNWWYGNFYYVKKQIVKPSRWLEGGAIPIVFPYDVLPVTVSWDKSQFNNPERDYSVITDWTWGGWFDAGGCTFKSDLKDEDSILIEDANYGKDGDNWNYFDGENNILFRIFYVAFGDKESVVAINPIISDPKMNIYPNPVVDFCHIEKASTANIRQIQLFSISGSKMIEINGNTSSIDCRGLSKGIYILSIETHNNKKSYHKLIKE